MQRYSADVLVLRTEERGEHDQLLTLLSADAGRFYAILKGAHYYRRQNAATEPCTWSNMSFYEKNGIKWVKDATALEPFPGIRKDTEKFFFAAYFCDVASALSDEGQPADGILQLTLNAIYMISTTNGQEDRIKAAFEMRAAAISGYYPSLAECPRCHTPVTDGMYLDVMNGSLVCSSCLHKTVPLSVPEFDALGERHILLPLTAACAAALRYVCEAGPRRIFAFELKDDASLAAFCRAAEAYLLHHLEHGFKTLEMLKQVRSMRPTPRPSKP